MKLSVAFTVVLMCLLAGCASKGMVKPEAVVVVQPTKRVPPAEAMRACPAPGELDDATFGAVVRKLGSVSELYKQCEQRRRELQEFIDGELPPVKNGAMSDPSEPKKPPWA